MATLSTYLNFDGTAEAAFNFYKSVFGGEFQTLQYIKDMPGGGSNFTEAERSRVMHVSLPIGGDSILMASDILPSVGHRLTVGNNTHINITPKDESEAKRLFDALSNGGQITMPLEKMFWGSLFGTCTDKFGIQWMINLPL
ncbi:VOC family protein [Pseudochryseolinea flava]|uniref:VOC family protein n=1 Tax=Pseudochryseolinea flava TaxID=2059302 RepID=A0A364XYB9_9BACT|nr:VOC family protein [Pseudochryseolinea flava]RAV98995.1 VOC family protein [Pseudochryseolinea flava]